MSLILTLDGAAIACIESFYAEVNRVFMAGEDWALGQSLDALDDLLYGDYGALKGAGAATLVWTGFEASRQALGVAATRAYLQAKIADPQRFNAERFARDLAALEQGVGKTYFDIVLEIIADHPKITLVRA